jgi:hypothetical protein
VARPEGTPTQAPALLLLLLAVHLLLLLLLLLLLCHQAQHHPLLPQGQHHPLQLPLLLLLVALVSAGVLGRPGVGQRP